MSDHPVDELTIATEAVAAALRDLLAILLNRASAQSASIVVPWMERQKELEGRIAALEKRVGDATG